MVWGGVHWGHDGCSMVQATCIWWCSTWPLCDCGTACFMDVLVGVASMGRGCKVKVARNAAMCQPVLPTPPGAQVQGMEGQEGRQGSPWKKVNSGGWR